MSSPSIARTHSPTCLTPQDQQTWTQFNSIHPTRSHARQEEALDAGDASAPGQDQLAARGVPTRGRQAAGAGLFVDSSSGVQAQDGAASEPRRARTAQCRAARAGGGHAPGAAAAAGPLPDPTRRWDLRRPSDAAALSAQLQDRLLCLPELNRNSPCYSARDLVLLFTKLKYLETFSQAELADYANAVDTAPRAHPAGRSAGREAAGHRGEHHGLFSRLATLLHIPCHGDAWNEIVKFAANALPFAEQTETLLVRGSDDRSALCPLTKTNNYNASTIPFATDVARGSCTCSSVTLEAFERCEKLRQELLLNSLSINPNAKSSSTLFNNKMRAVRTRVAACLGVSDLVRSDQLRILLSPSGTDAELLATVAGLARLYSGLGEEENLPGGVGPEQCKVTSIITAGGRSVEDRTALRVASTSAT